MKKFKIEIKTNIEAVYDYALGFFKLLFSNIKPSAECELNTFNNSILNDYEDVILLDLTELPEGVSKNDVQEKVREVLGGEQRIYTNGRETHPFIYFNNLSIIYLPESNSSAIIEPINGKDFRCYTTSNNLEDKAVFVKDSNKSNEYFILLSNRKENKGPFLNTYTSTYRPFVSKELKAMCFIIAKNACSSIIAAFYRIINPNISDTWSPWIPPLKHVKLLEDIKIKIEAGEELDEQYKGFRRFICLRNPIERFISIANFMYDPTTNVGYPYLRKYVYCEDPHKFINFVLDLCRGNSLLPELRDEHLMQQVDQLKDLDLSTIDDFVDIKDINKYFKEVFNIDLKTSNKTREKFVTVDDLTEDHLNQIKEIYKDDFDLYSKVNFWKSNK